MPTNAGEMTQTPPGDPQWVACSGQYIYGYAPPTPPQTARPHTVPPSTGTRRDYVRRVRGWSGTRGIGGWMIRMPLIATWYISTADDSSETTLTNPPTAQKPPAGDQVSDSPPQIPPGTPLSVTLSFQQWRELVEVLADAPFRKVSLFVGQIDRQCGEQLRANGAAGEQHANA